MIKNDNKLKWMQYQIVLNYQFTNYRVSKFNATVSSLCDLCHQSEEKLSHLYFQCNKVQQFLNETVNWLLTFNIKLNLNIKKVLFGIQEEQVNSRNNKLLLFIKNYIWITKLKKETLSLNTFKLRLHSRLKELKEVHEYANRVDLFNDWQLIFTSLTQDG